MQYAGRVRVLVVLVAALVLAALPAAAAAQRPAPAAERVDYRGTGVVLAVLPPPSDLHATQPVIVIRHQPIPPLMPEEMSMPFLAVSTDLLRGLRPGDRIAFGLRDVPGALLVVSLERLGPGR